MVGPLEEEFPLSDDPEATRMCIVVDGVTVGLIQYGEEPEADFRHAWVDIFVAADRHGAGIGTDALETLVEHLLTERGHHRVTMIRWRPTSPRSAATRRPDSAGSA